MNKPIPFLIDFDGVINLYGKPAPYCYEFFKFLERNSLPACILSNSTLKTALDIREFLSSNKLQSNLPVLTAADAAVKFVEKNYTRVSVFCVQSVKKEFAKFIDDKNPQAVIVGDLADNWSIKILNEIFNKVLNGADLVAMHMNRFWSPEKDKFVLDAGSYISAIEFASAKKPILIGKPSPIYFHTALKSLGYKDNSPFFMIGDDIELDINAAQTIGGKGILVLTGKTKLPIPKNLSPDFIAEDLSRVIEIIRKLNNL